MPKVTFIDPTGEPYTVNAEAGQSLMAAATSEGIPGIDADCGGAASCGTCHVILPPEWRTAAGPLSPQEDGLLSMREDRTDGSRLSCQIEAHDALDGLTLQVAPARR